MSQTLQNEIKEMVDSLNEEMSENDPNMQLIVMLVSNVTIIHNML